jgi:hypothetical protein
MSEDSSSNKEKSENKKVRTADMGSLTNVWEAHYDSKAKSKKTSQTDE